MNVPPSLSQRRSSQGLRSYRSGLEAEALVAACLQEAGYVVLAERLKTPFGEIDLLICTDECLVAVEVKRRRCLNTGAESLSVRQKARLLAAFDFIWATQEEWHRPETRFDCVFVDYSGAMKRIKNAFRQE
nr:YraN family protein [uncultured Neokomagataea sp.]